MNKKLILIALLVAITAAKFDFKQKMVENASSQIPEKIREIINKQNISQQDLEEFAKNHNLDIEKLNKIQQWKQKKAAIENAADLTEEQKQILKQKFIELKQQKLDFEEIKSQMKQFAESNGIDINSIKKHFMNKHQRRPRREEQSGEENNEIELTPEQIELIKNKFKELKKSGISFEEIKNQMKAFAEENDIDPELLKKLCRKHKEQQRRREKGFLHNKKEKESESESESESQSEEEQNSRQNLQLGKHEYNEKQGRREDRREERREDKNNNFEKRHQKRRDQNSEDKKGEHEHRQNGQNQEERGQQRHQRDERSEEHRQNKSHEEKRDRPHHSVREENRDRKDHRQERHHREEIHEQNDDIQAQQFDDFEISEELDF